MGTTSDGIKAGFSGPDTFETPRSACSFAKRREKSATAAFSFCRTGVVPCLVLARRPDTDPLYLMLRLRPKGPDSSICRVDFCELDLC